VWVGVPELIGRLPDLEKTHRRVESVVDSEGHADVRDDCPRPNSVELQVRRPKLCSVLLQAVNRPHRQVGHQKKRDQLPAWFAPNLSCIFTPSPPKIPSLCKWKA
jgi:hypothetical protein